MQLFITPFQLTAERVQITDPDTIHQAKRVMRIKAGGILWVQDKHKEHIMRYKIEVSKLSEKILEWKIIEQESQQIDTKKSGKTMIVAMPNKWQKAELIVQKLTEIGIDEIIFWNSQRSVEVTPSSNKTTRINRIAREAVEQSRWRNIPVVQFIWNKEIEDILKDKNTMIFDKRPTDISNHDVNREFDDSEVGIVWPEGGLTSEDYRLFGKSFRCQNLGSNVLRVETAAIVGAWVLVNNILPGY